MFIDVQREPSAVLVPPRGRRTCAAWLTPIAALCCLCSCTDAADRAPSGGQAGVVGVVACEADGDCGASADRCAAVRACVDGACVVSVGAVICDSGEDDACRAAVCAPATGTCALAPRREGQPCEDGDPCSFADRCEAGVCTKGEVDACECLVDADCPDDDDACNGVPYCDVASFPHRCRTQASTVVVCDAAIEPGGCTTSACDKTKGACVPTPVDDGVGCDDGDVCTTGESCSDGVCAGGDAVCSCASDADCPDPDDDPCTGVQYCEKGEGGAGLCKPKPASAVSCSTSLDTACLKNSCAPATGACGLVAVNDAAPCDDGDACTAGEVCKGGVCAGGTDTCGCQLDADCAAKEDGDACNGTLYCDKASGACLLNQATVVFCVQTEDSACAKNACVPASGACKVMARAAVVPAGCLQGPGGKLCKWIAAAMPSEASFPCEDGDPCTSGDSCEGESCVAGVITCACSNDADCLATDDGDLCNGVPYCDAALGVCKANPASAVFCNKSGDSDCVKALCAPSTGTCGLSPVEGSCDDGDLCTTADACGPKGVCAGVAASCDDGNACTIDSCDSNVGGGGAGCVHEPKVCDDGNACTQESCDPSAGKCTVGVAVAAGKACNADDDGCTVGDACDGKAACVAGPPRLCAEQKGPCVPSQCVSAGAQDSSCSFVTLPDGSPCDDGASCLRDDTCKGGVCEPGKTSTLWTTTMDEDKAAVGGLLCREDGEVVSAEWLVDAPARWRLHWQKLGGAERFAPLVLKPPAGEELGAVIAVLDLEAVGVAVVGRVAKKGEERSGLVVVSPEGKAASFVPLAPSDGAMLRLGAAALHPSGNLALGETVYVGGKPEDYRIRMVATDGAEVWSTTIDAYLPHEVDDLAFPSTGGVVFTATSKQWNSPINKTYFPFSVGHIGGGGEVIWKAGWIVAPHDPVNSAALIFDNEEFVFFSRDNSRSPRWNPFLLTANAPAGNRRHIGGTFHPIDVITLGARALAVGEDGNGPALALLDRFGNAQWVRALGLPQGAQPVRVAFDETNGRVAVAATLPKAPSLPGLAPTAIGASIVATRGLWGEPTCAKLGACADQTYAGCDDGNPCTDDECAAAGGCKHSTAGTQICAPASGCSAYGTCYALTCNEAKYGRLIVSDLYMTDAAAAMVTRRDGAIVGWQRQGGNLQGQQIAADGYLSFTESYDAQNLTTFSQMLTTSEGVVLALGRNDTTKKVGVLHFSPPSKSTALLTLPTCSGCTHAAAGIAQHSDGSVVVAVTSSGSGPSTGELHFFTAALEATAVHTLSSTADVVLNAVAFDAYGAAVAVGRRAAAGPSCTPLLALRDAAGGTALEAPLGSLAGVELEAVLATTAGELIAGGRRYFSLSTNAAAVVAADSAGKLLWQQIPTSPDNSAFTSLLEAQGGFVALGPKVLSGKLNLLLTRRKSGADAAPLWTRTHLVDDSTNVLPTPGSLIEGLDGDLVFGGRQIGGSGRGYFGRADADGHLSCSEAGKCADVTKSCDDKNPCTADWCDPEAGCAHLPLTGTSCGGSGVCATGVCVGG